MDSPPYRLNGGYGKSPERCLKLALPCHVRIGLDWNGVTDALLRVQRPTGGGVTTRYQNYTPKTQR